MKLFKNDVNDKTFAILFVLIYFYLDLMLDVALGFPSGTCNANIRGQTLNFYRIAYTNLNLAYTSVNFFPPWIVLI